VPEEEVDESVETAAGHGPVSTAATRSAERPAA
jgi:hypothetical protein